MTQPECSPTNEISRGSEHYQQAEAELAAAREVLRVSEERYRKAFDTSLDAIAICRMDTGMFVDSNRAFSDLLGYSREELIGQVSTETITWIDPYEQDQCVEFIDVSGKSTKDLGLWVNSEDWERLVSTLSSSPTCRDFQAMLRRKDGKTAWVQISACTMELDGVQCILFVTHDLSAIKAAEEKILRLFYYDPLTSLPNHRFLLDRLGDIEIQSDNYRAFFLVGLDNLKFLSESNGQIFGDLLVQEIAERITEFFGKTSIVARVSNDEFGIVGSSMGTDLKSRSLKVLRMAQELRGRLSLPLSQSGHRYRCAISIGICVFGTDFLAPEQIIQRGSIALRSARRASRDGICFFAEELQADLCNQARLEGDIDRAIGHNEFCLYYQPQYRNQVLIGAESLARWKHPQHGLLPPGKFIPIAEESGLIVPLGDTLFENCCHQLAFWQQSKKLSPEFSLAFNISAKQFHHPDFVQKIISALQRSAADPRNLEIELTETSLLQDIDTIACRMSDLKAYGIRFSLDDFGTGYSSLSYLSKLPFDKIKIDIAFVRAILTDRSSSAIAQAIISLGRTMELAVIAEGVETEAQRDYLLQIGCSSFQGYLFSPPLPQEAFSTLLEEQTFSQYESRSNQLDSPPKHSWVYDTGQP